MRDVQAARERVCDCSALKEYPEGYEVDEFNAALDAYAEAVRRDERAQMPCYRIWTGGFTPCVPSGPLCPSCATRAEQEAT